MSTDYTLHCKQCDETPVDFEMTNQTHVLESIYRLRAFIVAIAEQDKTGYLEFGVMGKSHIGGLVNFLVKHKAHEMDIRNEYGACVPIEGVPTPPAPVNAEWGLLIQAYAIFANSNLFDPELFDEWMAMESVKEKIEQYFKTRGWELDCSDFSGWGIHPCAIEKDKK